MRENTSSAARKPESRREVCFSLLAEMQVYSLLLSDLYSFLGKDAGEPFFGSQRMVPPQILCFRFFTAPYLLFFSRQCVTRRAQRMRRGSGERVKRGRGAFSGAPGWLAFLSSIKKHASFLEAFKEACPEKTENMRASLLLSHLPQKQQNSRHQGCRRVAQHPP